MASETPEPLTPSIRLQVPELQGALSREEYDLHELALEWGLSEPIVIRDEDDIKAKANWKDKLQPFEHQVQNLITFCRRLPVSIIADDVGLGKTISAGLILSELLVRRKVNRCLVVCTKLIAPQWIEELRDKFGIDGRWESGSAVRSLFRGDATVVTTTYESAREYMSEASAAGFDMLILDEAHKLRNLYGANSPPKMATAVHKALEARIFKYVLMLTATPMQNRIWDLYSLIDCLAVAKGHENPFGNQSSFASLYGNPFKQAGWSSSPSGRKFRETLRQYVVRARRATVRLSFPKRELRLERVPATRFDKQLMKIVANALDAFPRGKGLISSSLGVAMMSSPQALRRQLHNMAEDERAWKAAAIEVDAVVEQYVNPEKLAAVVNVCNQLRAERPESWRLVIFTCRLETLDMIVRRLTDMKIAVGVIKGGASSQNQKTIQQYSCEPPRINVIVSTDSGAEGVNLQAGNVLINYDLPWNPMVLEQRIGRVQRLGSTFAHVIIFNLAVKDSPEDRVVARLLSKLTEISESVGDIESILESASEEAGGGKSIEKQIQEMVTASLKGQDIEKQRMLAEESVANAKRRLEENEKELNQNLGDLSDLHNSGVLPPELTQNIPSRPVHVFLQDGLRLLGHRVTPDRDYGDNVFAVRYAGERGEKLAVIDRATWKEIRSATPHRPCDLYQPGQPLFERLVQTWRVRAASHVVPLHELTETWSRAVLEHWLEQIPDARLGKLTISNRKTHFGGHVRSLIRASNGVDQYEKLLTSDFRIEGHEPFAFEEQKIRIEPVQVVDLKRRPLVQSVVASAIREDEDVEKFCSFYNARLEEELPGAGNSEMRKKKIKDDFTVSMEAHVVSTDGYEYESCDVAAEVHAGDNDVYQLTFSLIPATGQIVHEPPLWEYCEQSGCEYPVEFMSRCDHSGTRCVRHFLHRSEESSRRALEIHMEVCQRTGKRAIGDEFLVSSYSGTRAVRSEFEQSSISKRIYLQEELDVCQVTGVSAGVDELDISAISNRRYRKDQSATCTITGTRGHVTEFATCEVSGSLVLHGEIAVSSVSGKKVARTLLQNSERNPSRMGLADEIRVCEVSGKRILVDEVGRCTYTGSLVDSYLLKHCEESGNLVLVDILAVCGVSGLHVSPTETEVCAVTTTRVLRRLCSQSEVSGRFALAEHCKTCDFTGATVLPDEILVSSCSGRSFRCDEAIRSELTERVGHKTEGIRCAISSQLLLLDELTISELSGARANPALMTTCPVSGRRVLPSELKRCEFTGAMVCPDQLFVSDYSGRSCLSSEKAVSEISGRQGHPSEFANCEVTFQHVLLSELVECAVTGKKVVESACFRSAVSGKLAIQGLAAKCELTGDLVLPEELVRSEVSGRRFNGLQSTRSEKSGRVAHSSEAAKCSVSGKLLLIDEVSASEISGSTADKELLKTCSVTGIQALPSELEESEFSNCWAIPSEMRISDVSGKRFCTSEGFESELSGKVGHSSEKGICQLTQRSVLISELTKCASTNQTIAIDQCLQSAVSQQYVIKSECGRCEITHVPVLTTELCVSQYSGKKFRSDQGVVSEKSGRIGHVSEAARCSVSNRLLLLDELKASEVSGRQADPELLKVCSITGKYALPSELEVCDFTGARALPEEMRISSVSGQRFCRTEAIVSELSGEIGHLSESGVCEVTGKKVLNSELVTCEVTKRTVLPSECSRSKISGKLAIKAECETCEISGVTAFSSELIASDISGKRFRKDEAVKSSYSGRVCHVSESVRCEYKRDRLLRDETGVSDVTKKTTASYELEVAPDSGRRGREEEFVTCEVSQRRILRDEVAKSVVSGLIVDRALLVPSDRSGLLALRNELETCARSGKLLLPVEMSNSAVSKLRVDVRLLERSDFSGLPALVDELLTCAESGKRGVPADGIFCSETGLWVAKQYTTKCAVTGKLIRNSVAVRSAISGRKMAPSSARRSFLTNDLLHPDEAAFCHWNEAYAEPSNIKVCKRTGLAFCTHLIDDSGEFKRIYPFLNGEIASISGSDFVPHFKKIEPEKFKRLRRLIYFRHYSSSEILFFRGHVDSKWYMSVYYVFFAARVKGESIEIISTLTCQNDDGVGWRIFP